MRQSGFRTAAINKDRIPVIAMPSQVAYIHNNVQSNALSEIFLCKKEVTERSASPTSTLSIIDQEGEDTSHVCVLDEAGADWSIAVSVHISICIYSYLQIYKLISFYLF